jgi:hypothetical protein
MVWLILGSCCWTTLSSVDWVTILHSVAWSVWMIYHAGLSWSSISLLMCWCGLIPWLHSCLGWYSGAVLIMPLFYWIVLIDTGWLNFMKVPVILIVCLVLLHADIDSRVPAWHISELLWTRGFLNCPENAVCHGWWETYIVCITCHMSILLVWLCGFWTVMEGLCWHVFSFTGSSSEMEGYVTAWESTCSPWKLMMNQFVV